MGTDLDTWFKREILPHEPALLRYLRRACPNPGDAHDLRQDIYIRVYETAATGRPHNPRAFLFATARNLIVDRIRRSRIVSIEAVSDLDTLNVLVDELSPERALSGWQELRRVTRALNRLPPRCREVVWLRKVDQLAHKEIADFMKVSVRTVESQVSKGMLALTQALHGMRGTSEEGRPEDAGEGEEEEGSHG